MRGATTTWRQIAVADVNGSGTRATNHGCNCFGMRNTHSSSTRAVTWLRAAVCRYAAAVLRTVRLGQSLAGEHSPSGRTRARCPAPRGSVWGVRDFPGASAATTCGSSVSLVLLASLSGVGCAATKSHLMGRSWDTSGWHTGIQSSIVVIEAPPDYPRCTGAVIGAADGATYVLTARHCVMDDEQRGYPVSVASPKHCTHGFAWEHRPAQRIVVSTGHDWALVRIQPLPGQEYLKLANDRRDRLRRGERVTLVSYFDPSVPQLFPHEHKFAWDEVSEDVDAKGHSGAPVLQRGQIPAMFCGSLTKWRALGLVRWTAELQFVMGYVIAEEAADCGILLDGFDGILTASGSARCRELTIPRFIPDKTWDDRMRPSQWPGGDGCQDS